MLEDQTTIEKSSKLILELSSKEDGQSHNQLARWVATKESHASKIQKIIAEYFLTQRIKSSSKNYEKLLLKANKKIEIIWDSVVDEVLGDKEPRGVNGLGVSI